METVFEMPHYAVSQLEAMRFEDGVKNDVERDDLTIVSRSFQPANTRSRVDEAGAHTQL